MSGGTLHVGIDATTWANDRGFGRFTRELTKALIARDTGFRYTLIVDRPLDGLPANTEVLCASTAHALNEATVGGESRSFSDLWRMSVAASRAKFDVFFFPAVYSYFPLLSSTRCVICYHDCTAERFPDHLFPKKINHWLWQAKTRLALRQTTRAMTVTQASARDIETILDVPRAKIDVVTEGADPMFRRLDQAATDAARKRYGVGGRGELLATLGGMNAHKNILGLLKAMPEIIARRPNVRLAIVGDTSGRGFWDNVPELFAYVQAHPPLSKHVQFTGYLDDTEVVHLLNAADALVFPSFWEGFGLPALEAMQCGTPVLASRRGSLPEVVGEAGLLFEPEDPRDIAACVVGFLEDDDLRYKLAQAAVERARAFSWARAAELAEISFRTCYEDRGRAR